MTPRKLAANAIAETLVQKESTNTPDFSELTDPRDRSFARALYWGTLKHYYELDEWLMSELLQKPLKAKDIKLKAMLLMGLYQIRHMNVADYAAVSETVKLTRREWQKRLLNACLRHALKNKQRPPSSIEALYNHPSWLIQRIKAAYPEHWQTILAANNAVPPATLRVIDKDKWLAEFNGLAHSVPGVPSAVILEEACDIRSLPGYATGDVFVQDAASQIAASLLDVHADDIVLDACAAPGGKACHVGLKQPRLILMDKAPHRLDKLRENIQRAGIEAKILLADASTFSFDPESFTKIIVDAPCSATGIIRRHPDIKLNRNEAYIESLNEVQKKILINVWPALRPGGRLLYCTCSILPEENEGIIASFLAQCRDAHHLPLDAEWGIAKTWGRQILPETMDGFYYCLLEKEITCQENLVPPNS